MEITDGLPVKLISLKSVTITGLKIPKKNLLELITMPTPVKNIPENILPPPNN